jgi:hypothetical protein
MIVLAIVFAGCDQIAEVTSGGGTKNSSSGQVSAGTISGQVNDQDADDGEDESNGTESDSEDDAESSESTETETEKTWDAVLADLGLKEEPEPEEESKPSNDRNVEQYPRTPRNVTWKPVSSSSGGNLTIVLWGRGGGEKNYEEGSLRIEHNDGVTYPRTYVRRDDPDNGERAPKFYFDVEGGWFKGKDPVLFWNLGAVRVVNPEKRQGKHEQ